MSSHQRLVTVALASLVLFATLTSLTSAANLKHGRRAHTQPHGQGASPAHGAVKTAAETPAETPAKAPAETPAETLAKAPAKTPAETPAETLAKAPAKTPDQVAMEIAQLLGHKAARAEPTADDWTSCSKPCDKGSRHDTVGMGWSLTCNAFSCDFNTSCSCGEADLVFILDASGSIGSESFWVAKQFLLDVVTGLERVADPAALDTRFAAVYYAWDAIVAFDFDTGYTLRNVTATNDAIWEIPYTAGNTNTADGLRAAAELFIDQGIQGQKRIAILLSDGVSNENVDDTIPAADCLKAQGVTTYAIGVSDGVDQDELKAIASDPDNLYFFYVTDFSGLEGIIEQVLDGTCCDSIEPECSVSESGACSVECEGGITWSATTCVYKDYYGNIINTEVFNDTADCCEIPCPPPVEDCKKSNFTNSVGYLQDLANCHCFYQCEIIGPDTYRQYHLCCASGLFWNPFYETCDYEEMPNCIVPPYSNCDTNPWNTPAPTGTTLPTTTTPCPYQQSPDNPADYTLSGIVIGTCGSGLIWGELNCTCVPGGTGTPCESDVLLHFPFDDHLNDVSCLGAYSQQENNVTNLTPNGIKGNAAHFTLTNFLTVPAMNNYLAGRYVDTWTVSLWFWRDGSTAFHMGLTNNGDSVNNPSWTVYVTDDGGVSAGVGTWDSLETVRLNPVSVPFGRWNHVAMVYDGVSLKLYFDGTLQPNQKALTGRMVSRQCPMAIGIEGTDGYPGIFDGYIDELLVYERALTASEIMALYTNP